MKQIGITMLLVSTLAGCSIPSVEPSFELVHGPLEFPPLVLGPQEPLPEKPDSHLPDTVAPDPFYSPDNIHWVGARYVSDLDFKGTSVRVNLRAFPGAVIYLRSGLSPAALNNPSAEVPVICTPPSGNRRWCHGILAANAIETGERVLKPGDTIFYQWFIDYGVGNVEPGPLRSFAVRNPPDCTACLLRRSCVVIDLELLGSPSEEVAHAGRCVFEKPENFDNGISNPSYPPGW